VRFGCAVKGRKNSALLGRRADLVAVDSVFRDLCVG
jgi:hypothetical protein